MHDEITASKFHRCHRKNANFTRKDFVKLKDIRNLEQKLISLQRMHKNDNTSLELLVKNWTKEDFSPILLFQSAHSSLRIGVEDKGLKESDFIFGFQTEAQMTVMKNALDNMLFIDCTHSTNLDGYQLLNVVCCDAFRRAYPVAFFIVPDTSAKTIAYCLNTLKKRTPDLSVEVQIFLKTFSLTAVNLFSIVFSRLLC